MLIVVILLIIYGVEVLFKVSGGLLIEKKVKKIDKSRRNNEDGEKGRECEEKENKRLFERSESNKLIKKRIEK
jgi:hypothetical protein